MRVHLRVANGQYVCAENGGGGTVVANRDKADIWETFDLTSVDVPPLLPGKQVTFKSVCGYYFCAESGGSAPVVANRSAIGPWETFALEMLTISAVGLHGCQIALRAVSGKYVCAEGGGGRELIANRDAVGPWETFTLETEDAGGDLDSAIDHLGRMPPIVLVSGKVGPETSLAVDVNGVAYRVTEQRFRTVSDIVEHAFLQDMAAMGVWPGQLIQGGALLRGDIAPIGPFARRSGKLLISTDLISNTPHPQSADLDHPDAATVNQARWALLNAANPAGAAGLLKASFERASTLREVGVKLGVSAKGSAFGVDANASLNQSYRASVVVASIRQVFYTVTFIPGGAGATGFWPSNAVSYQDLERYVSRGNPPLYIDCVQYGRFICVLAKGALSSSEISAALRGSWTASVSGTVSIDARTKEVLERSEVKIYTLGVPGRQNFQTLSDPVKELPEVYRSGMSLTIQNPGAPISFTTRHIADNSLAHVGLVAEYIQPLSAQGEDVNRQEFRVYDSPGGGLVDTRIRVNPLDTVTVSASGLIWSGKWFFGDHGPEGYAGWQAWEGSPLPGKTAYCLIIRFGNGPWIEAGRFWEGSPPDGVGGVLQLNINDDNPYNGDPSKYWTVVVDVKRAGAEAAGVYI